MCSVTCKFGDQVSSKQRFIILANTFLVPLFWSQPGSSLKPPPVLDRPVDKTLDVTRKHFDRTIKVYGPHVSAYISLMWV